MTINHFSTWSKFDANKIRIKWIKGIEHVHDFTDFKTDSLVWKIYLKKLFFLILP